MKALFADDGIYGSASFEGDTFHEKFTIYVK